MSISEKQYQQILRIIESLSGGLDSVEVRERAGVSILDLMQADYFASYVWSSEQRRFCDRVFVGMDPENLDRYDSYYQFHDPITGSLQRFRRPVAVNEVMPQGDLMQTEFYNDFLQRDGLHYGVNLYVYDGDTNIGDIRVWRGRHRENFSREDLQLLEMIKPHFRNAMKNMRLIAREDASGITAGIELAEDNSNKLSLLMERHQLTRREAEIALEIAHGRSDKEIALACCISFSTVRTHLKNIYQKLGVHSRSALASLISQ
jgi:DNA-binding CsgD family transcriptional regulator